MVSIHSVSIPAFPKPDSKYALENESQFRRQLERSLTDVVAFVSRSQEDPEQIADHVVATTSGLGAQHIVSGLTAGQVLRASGVSDAAFAVLDFTDLAGKISNAQVDSIVTYGNLKAVDTLNVEVASGGQAMLIDGGTDRYINLGTTGAGAHTPTFNSYSSGVRIVIDDTIGASDTGVAIGRGNSGASRMWCGVGTDNGDFRWYANLTEIAKLSSTVLTVLGTVTGESGVTVGKGITGGDKILTFFGRAADGAADSGSIQMNKAGVLTTVIVFEHSTTHFQTNDVKIDGSLDVNGLTVDVDRILKVGGSVLTGIPTFTINDNASAVRRSEATIYRWSKNLAEVQSTWNESGTAPDDWATIRHELYRITANPPNNGDVVLFSPVSYIPVTGGAVDIGWFKWFLPTDPVNEEIDLDIKARIVKVKGILTVTGAMSAVAGTFTGLLKTPASATGGAGFRLPEGAAPTSPVGGDTWVTTAGMFVRANSVTIGPFTSGITAVVAGAGLTGGGSSGSVTLNVVGTTNRISVAANSIDIDSGYVGQASITTVGTLATGVGIGLARTDGTLHIHTASAGSITAATSADDLVIENNGDAGFSILIPDNRTGQIFIGSPADSVGAAFSWRFDQDVFRMSSKKVGASIIFQGDNGIDNLILSGAAGSELAEFKGNLLVVGLLTTAATASGSAGLNLPHGIAPSSPVDGDLWTTSSAMFVRINGVTKEVAFV